MKRRVVSVHAGGRCALRCAPCDCRGPGSFAEARRTIRGGGGRLVVRGAPESAPELAVLVAAAREEGFGEIVIRTNALGLRVPGEAARLKSLGADAVLVPLFSERAAVHDRVAGHEGALIGAIVGMRAAAAEGLRVEVETPILPGRIQDLAGVVEMARRSVPGLAAVRFFLAGHELPAALAPPPFDAGEERLARAIARAGELGVAAPIGAAEAIPLCALAHSPSAQAALRVSPRGRVRRAGSLKLAPCRGCAVERQCAGVPRSYEAAHGAAGLAPYRTRPRALDRQRTTPLRQWNDEERDAARRARILVLRPTVHCNQDCQFCSANETTRNVWADPDDMVRAIARAAQRGVQRVSFSGGEPTLSKELPRFVAVARQAGIPTIELVTNGVLLDREEKVEALREAGLTHAFVSLHAHDELLSRAMTQKKGDFERTLRAIELLVGAGVVTVVNHVVNERSYRYLERFVALVRERFEGRTMISFAFVSPQFKARENMELVPRISDVMPYLRRAAHRAIALEQPFVIGSRQGIPPCFLGELKGWSDLLDLAHEARSEDAPQKVRAAACDGCRYTRFCPGLWKPYAERYGTGELRAVAGAPFDEEERRVLVAIARPPPWGMPRSFDGVPERLRDREAEAHGPYEALPEPPLPSYALSRSRPVRTILVGAGRRGRALLAAVPPGLSIDAVVSPHAPDAELPGFVGPRYAELGAALADLRPEAAIVAAPTAVHAGIARACLEAGAAVLCEKPMASSAEEAAALVALAESRGGLLAPAHQELFGMEELAGPGSLLVSRRVVVGAPDAPVTWDRRALYELLHHLVGIGLRLAGGGALEVGAVSFHGDAAPKRIRATGRSEGREIELLFDAGTEDELLVRVGPRAYCRRGREVTLDGGAGPRPVEPRGGDAVRMLEAFRDAVLGRSPYPVPAADGPTVMRSTRALVDALDAAGAPFDRPGAPRHVASRGLVPGYH